MRTKKYELTNETLNYRGHVLHRIKALINFGNVKAGQLGGWIESENNLSQYGYCWVTNEAKVYGNAKVFVNAWVCDNADIGGNAKVCGYATVYDNAMVYGDAKVHGNAVVCDKAQVYGYAIVRGNAMAYGDAKVKGDTKVEGDTKVGGIEKVCGDNSTPKNNSNMENKYKVSINITMSKDIYVDAENEEDAKKKAIENIKENSYHFADSAGFFVNSIVTNIVNESEDIREWLISQLKIKSDTINSDTKNMIKNAITWLEKQGGKSVK